MSTSAGGADDRPLGATELSWCRAVPGGTGVTVLALLMGKPPELKDVEKALQKLQNYHPILRGKICPTNPSGTEFSLRVPASSNFRVRWVDTKSTAEIIGSGGDNQQLSPFQKIIEQEMKLNPWAAAAAAANNNNNNNQAGAVVDVFHASVYELESEKKKWVVVMKVHAALCDRASAVAMMRELMDLMVAAKTNKLDEEEQKQDGGLGKVTLGIEEYIPSDKSSKPFWARGMNMIGYSLNSFRMANLEFVDAESNRCSQFVRLRLGKSDTTAILEGCRRRGIKLCGALGAAAIVAARQCKRLPEGGEWEKFSVVILIYCRPFLKPALTSRQIGFYHTAIMSTHDVNGTEKMWELARRTYLAFKESKGNNKHFTDMEDLNYLMCKAIENPTLTPSSSSRTSFLTICEDPVVDDHNKKNYDAIGLEDYMGCASVHGVGPSVAMFEAIRDGELDCAVVYPAPLHSRPQMMEFVDNIKKNLVAAARDS